jgi:hypothetical protein
VQLPLSVVLSPSVSELGVVITKRVPSGVASLPRLVFSPKHGVVVAECAQRGVVLLPTKRGVVNTERADITERTVVAEVDVIAKHTVLVAKLGVVAEHGVVVSKLGVVAVRHVIVGNRCGVVAKLGIDVIERAHNCVANSPIILSAPPERSVVVTIIAERAPSGARVSLGCMESSASGMALLPKGGIVVIGLLPSTTV